MRYKILVAVFLFFSGSLMIFIGVYKLISDSLFNNKSIQTTGHLLYYHPEIKLPDTTYLSMGMPISFLSSGRKSFYPVVEFMSKDGKIIKYRAAESYDVLPSQETENLPYKIGDVIGVRYDSLDPSNAALATERQTSDDFFVIIFGFIFLSAGVVVYKKIIKTS